MRAARGRTRPPWTTTATTPTMAKTAPMAARPKPSRRRPNRAKVASKALKAPRASVTPAGAAIGQDVGIDHGDGAAWPTAASRGLDPAGRVSGSRLTATRALARRCRPRQRTGGAGPPKAASPPMAGPMTKPTP